ncbi:hydroxylysine kinase, partial [Exaiptasia diaphana]|uniref:Hydroxylysine kinase n=1 Tax=Exaiptasia diaphana TaxID=2652724 RepID=A0A913XRW8_EXADI
METRYSSIKIETKQAEAIAKERYGIEGTAVFMPGELDFNFKIQTENEAYLLKVGRPELEMDYVEFQTALLRHAEAGLGEASPKTFTDVDGNHISKITDEHGEERIVRLLSWIDGRLWSSVNPISGRLLTNLGKKAGELTKTLDSFDHPYAGRYLEWDIANALWCKEKLELFEGEEKRILTEFLERFEKIQGPYQLLRKSVVHSDVNDNNIVVSEDLANPTVQSIIDFGDAVRTQTINDVAIALAYAMMHQHDPLEAATAFVKGYSSAIQLREDELEMLHTLTAMRLTITVTKAAMNKIAEPENEYHQ